MGKKIDQVKFDEYKLFIDDTARFTDRRQNASNLYVTVNSLLLTAIAFIVKDALFKETWAFLLTIPIIVSGIFVSIWWKQLLHRYRELGRLRFRALREMEKSPKLDGIEKMYHHEDKLYPRNPDGTVQQGKGLNFSDLESKLPTMFIVLYSIALTGVLIALAIILCK
ncbi:MAG: hypothetical protein HN736_09180 [Anaerolineae bacterium]|jgi:hypothetical protein|nr:hypothetical protein [Anaerolineae bacterium]MBT3712921.1 hypothetical protein [Anaerolineae bacterium]MBT4310221.1 hypothetical protein [Anaerolineae bacterium]MBT4460022.1 hypothetical protein [Anaerolineae bacterium]MBT4842199.1 hypothetical protein [Anaerolineae bacterium]